MKYIKIITLSLTILIGMRQQINAQTTDSLATQSASYLKQLLSLSDNQYNGVKEACIIMANTVNDMQQLNTTPEDRAIHLREIHTTYRTALQHILTTEQWNIYEAACTKTQQAFEQHLQQQKIKYTLLKTQ